MIVTTEQLLEISIDELFNQGNRYIVPIYQRNYAWDDFDREQLLEDIMDYIETDDEYFLGSLIVFEKEDSVYEIIDGQQRLTTLFILLAALKEKVSKNSLTFEARKKSNYTLEQIAKNAETFNEDFCTMELLEALRQFQVFINERLTATKLNKFKNKLRDVKLLRIIVPADTDLNHYFEIMNTRGEQLEAHEILKARLMSQISGEDVQEKRKVFATIWDACSNMDQYIQMSFAPSERAELFGNDYGHLKFESFSEITESLEKSFEESTDETHDLSATMSVSDAIMQYNKSSLIYTDDDAETEDKRFEPIINFPNFLLHVLKIYKDDQNLDEDYTLDDKRLLDLFDEAINPEKFIYLLLKTRFLFDHFIIKREYYGNYLEEGTWSLKSLKDYGGNSGIDYVNTISDDKKIRTIQSVLRVTYTSPKTMHWISMVLGLLNKHIEDKNISDKLLNLLETYARTKVSESVKFTSNARYYERIVYTYLDYIIWRDGHLESSIKAQTDFEFTFRNSIEHFYPQNPDTTEDHIPMEQEMLDNFGNLCLITVSANSKFSNQMPEAKKTNKNTVKSSQKLQIMVSTMEKSKDKWNENLIIQHGREMQQLLNEDLKKLP